MYLLVYSREQHQDSFPLEFSKKRKGRKLEDHHVSAVAHRLTSVMASSVRICCTTAPRTENAGSARSGAVLACCLLAFVRCLSSLSSLNLFYYFPAVTAPAVRPWPSHSQEQTVHVVRICVGRRRHCCRKHALVTSTDPVGRTNERCPCFVCGGDCR